MRGLWIDNNTLDPLYNPQRILVPDPAGSRKISACHCHGRY
jgi:hypothetical protein